MARVPPFNSAPGSVGPHFSGNSPPQPGFSRRTPTGAVRPARVSPTDCIPTMAASRANESPALETHVSGSNRSRRRNKVRGFIIAETVALGVLFLAGGFVLSAGPINSTVITALNVVMLAAAVGVATIPILFFAFAPILPRSNH